MDFFGMGPMELGIIVVIALIIFGPGKLPEIASQVGGFVREVRNTTSGLTGELNEAMSEVKGVANEMRQVGAEVQESTRSLTRLDQEITPASAPSNPIVAQQIPTAPRPRTGPVEPTKADPLADLMG